ncbi:alpha-glucosidase [Devosia pacifica]|uniref:Alpha-glucosidase n=1 Tax=Devosia pacifica TaxID=1335967 RepID=A0A918VU21_9HYPH|nr:alpha-glucosidase family protein [Devosia pacifica]GHA23522.1 alpha-glucosidase [Devosia pacifica]
MNEADWWRGGVIYEIYPRSFADSDGDGIGDLKGITQRLQHVADLGVDAIWITPFFKSPMADFGYDVADYRAVDPLFGSLKDFDDLVDKAHRLGLKVLIDHVISHTSDQHEWFVESRSSRENDKADWYVWADRKADGTAPNNWLSVFGGPAWQWDTRRRQYYLHNFLVSQPDLNIHHPQVQDAILNEMRFWLQRGVDGFRLDALNFSMHDRQLRDNPPAEHPELSEHALSNPYAYQVHLYDKSQPELLPMLSRIRSLLDEFGATASLAEVGDDRQRSLELMAQYSGPEGGIHMCYGFDFLSDVFTPRHVAETLERYHSQSAQSWPCWAFSNHDCMRHASRFTKPGTQPSQIARLAAAVLLSLRGSVCLYQGEELGLSEADIAFEDLQDPAGKTFWPDYKGRDGCRTPMPWQAGAVHAGFSSGTPWLPMPKAHEGFAVSEQTGDPSSTLEFYRQVLSVRRRHTALRSGELVCRQVDDQVLVLERKSQDETVLVAFNFSANPVSPDLGKGRVILTSSEKRLDQIEPFGFRWVVVEGDQ